jgi:hypothetical protein
MLGNVTFRRNGDVFVSDQGEGDFIASKDDPLAILEWLECAAEMETGMTVGDLVTCLVPWDVAIRRLVNVSPTLIVAVATVPPPFDTDSEDTIQYVRVKPSITVERDENARSADIAVYWSVSGVRVEKPNPCFSGTEYRHPSELWGLPLVFEKVAGIEDDILDYGMGVSEEEIVHPTADGSIREFIAVPKVFDTVIHAFMESFRVYGR